MKKSSSKQARKPVRKSAPKADVLFDPSRAYPIAEAIEYAKKSKRAKFDESVEVHVHLGINPSQGGEQVRSVTVLPHGTGKTKRIAVIVDGSRADEARAAGADIVGGDDILNQIKSAGSIAADIVISTPDMMPKLAQVARILGPKGLMPTPKNETITQDVGKAVREMKGGKVAFKNDDTANVHQVIGKISWDTMKLTENFFTFIDALKKAKPAASKGVYLKHVVIATTMGPGIKVSV